MNTLFRLLKPTPVTSSTFRIALVLGVLTCSSQAQKDAEVQVQAKKDGEVQALPIPEKVDKLLKNMSKRLTKAKTFVMEADLLIDEVLDSGLLVQRAAKLKLQAQRPNGLRAIMTSDTEERTIWYDGETMTIADVDDNVHVTVPVPDKIGPAMDHIMDHYGVSIPLSDFFHENPYEALTASVERAYYIGMSQVNGVACHHLAFAQESVDWQLWIEAGDRPLPRKLVIVYKNDLGAPHYTATLASVKLQDPVPKDTFNAVIPDGSLRIDLLDIAPDASTQK
jgi:hypothetical protein